MTLEAIKAEIEKLPREQRRVLAAWVADQDDAVWDEQIKADFDSGKFQSLIQRAQKEFDDGSIREAP